MLTNQRQELMAEYHLIWLPKYNSFLVRLDICGEQTDRICLVCSLLDVLYDNSFMIYAFCRRIRKKKIYYILW